MHAQTGAGLIENGHWPGASRDSFSRIKRLHLSVNSPDGSEITVKLDLQSLCYLIELIEGEFHRRLVLKRDMTDFHSGTSCTRREPRVEARNSTAKLRMLQ